jgi:hypothetical protein
MFEDQKMRHLRLALSLRLLLEAEPFLDPNPGFEVCIASDSRSTCEWAYGLRYGDVGCCHVCDVIWRILVLSNRTEYDAFADTGQIAEDHVCRVPFGTRQSSPL